MAGPDLFLQWLLHQLWSAIPQSPFSLLLFIIFIHFSSPYRLPVLSLIALPLDKLILWFYLTFISSLFGLCCHVSLNFPAISRGHAHSKGANGVKEDSSEWIGEGFIFMYVVAIVPLVVIATCHYPKICILPSFVLIVLMLTCFFFYLIFSSCSFN